MRGLEFEPVSLERRKEYVRILKEGGNRASDYTFVNLWGWAENYGLTWAFGDDFVLVRQEKPEVLYWSPVCAPEKCELAVCALFTQAGDSMELVRVPSGQVDAISAIPGIRARVAEDVGHWDYVYSIEDMVELKGNKYHKKKNLYNQFIRENRYAYCTLTPDLVEQVLDMQKKWFDWHEFEGSRALIAENNAIFRVLSNYDEIECLFGGVITIGGEVVAYTIAECLSPDTLVIHFEKAHTSHKGSYQAINRLFLENGGGGFKFVNREQDLNDPGLRKAKQSYHPVDFVRKYGVGISRI